MAYDKHTWTCDEPITVERLNHIEDGIAAGGDCDCGYECEDGRTTLTEETVTTTMEQGGTEAYGDLSYSQLIDADSITVTFNGTEYECPCISMDGGFIYGGFAGDAPDFSQYPFTVASSSTYGNILYTETAGTYAIKIEGTKEVVTTTPCFEKAVKSIGGDVVYAKMEYTVDEDGCYIYTLDITDADLAQIIRNGQQLVILESTNKSGSGNYVMYYPTLVWANGVSPATEVLRVIDVGGLGDPVAMVTITIVDHFTLNEHLLTLFAYSGTASPRYLEGRTCVSQDPLIVPLNKDISAATTSSPVESSVEAYYEIANALENGVSVYLQEGNSKTNLLVTAYNAGSGMSDATITVNVETYNSTLNVTYSMPATFYFDQDGYCYYPPSGSST